MVDQSPWRSLTKAGLCSLDKRRSGNISVITQNGPAPEKRPFAAIGQKRVNTGDMQCCVVTFGRPHAGSARTVLLSSVTSTVEYSTVSSAW